MTKEIDLNKRQKEIIINLIQNEARDHLDDEEFNEEYQNELEELEKVFSHEIEQIIIDELLEDLEK